MKSFLFLILTVVFAMILPGAEAGTLGGLRRRRNPVIKVGLSAVRQIVGPFDRFKIMQKDSEDQEVYIEDEEFDYYHSMSMSMSMSMTEPYFPDDLELKTPDEEEQKQPLVRGGRVRGGLIRRKFGGGP